MSWWPPVSQRVGEENEEEDADEEINWTTDGKPPYICWHVNAHGSMNDHRHSDAIPNDKKQTDMDVRAFSIAGNGNQFGLMGVVSDIPVHGHEDYECNKKAIDYAIPSVLRKVFYAAKQNDGDRNNTYNVAIKKVRVLYFHAGLFHDLQKEGGFEVMEDPTRFHYYQLHGNKGENTRQSSNLKLPKREAAGDMKLSDQMIYGLWVVDTNITVLQDLALTSITDEELRILPENRKGDPTHLFLPPKLLNRLNMASRSNGEPLGGVWWTRVLTGLNKYDHLDSKLKELRVRAINALGNIWRTRKTNSHDIIDIFTPFSEIGKKLGNNPLKLYTIDVSCRSKFGVMVPPNPQVSLPEDPFQDSQQHYDGRPDDGVGSPSLSKGVTHGDDGGGASAGDPMATDVPLTSHPSMRSPPPKPTPNNTSHRGVSKKPVLPPNARPFLGRPPWRGGGTKRKYSRKRNTRTMNRHTRRRQRRRQRH